MRNHLLIKLNYLQKCVCRNRLQANKRSFSLYQSLSLQDLLITICVLRSAELRRGAGEHNLLDEIETPELFP